jgi:hypothetical protein
MKKVLVIGMLDSVHFYRWLSQFTDQQVDFTIYPSTKFRSMHPELVKLLKANDNFHLTRIRFMGINGYKEYFINNYLSRVFKRFSSAKRLNRIINKYDFDYIHALEIQGAGYLLRDAYHYKSSNFPKIIITNWGSDIYYFEKDPVHKDEIQSVLKIADYYSAECHRDYELALRNGFKGKFLPINPNAGGFKRDIFQINLKNSSDRNLIIAKCYGGNFGLGHLIIQAVDRYFEVNNKISIFFYSVTPDLIYLVNELTKKYPKRVNFSTVRNKLTIDDMYEKFGNAKIYVGASKSDGISTSFLEALVLGAYPIQTKTSCGNEWVDKGFHATIIETTADAVFNALMQLDQSENLDYIRKANKFLAMKYLDFETIKLESLGFYGLARK